MKQVDSSLLHCISVADEGLGEMCFPVGLHYPFILPFWKSLHIWRYKDTLSRKKSHKATSISMKFVHSCWES